MQHTASWKLIVSQLVKSPAFVGTRRFITSDFQFSSTFYLRLGFPSCLFPTSLFAITIWISLLPIYPTRLSRITIRDLIIRLNICDTQTMKLMHFSLVSFYRGADKSLSRPTSRCILFDGENISFHASLLLFLYIYIYIYIVLIFLQLWLWMGYMNIKTFCRCSLFPSWSG